MAMVGMDTAVVGGLAARLVALFYIRLIYGELISIMAAL